MQHATPFIPQYYQGNTMYQQPGTGDQFVVVDEQPNRKESFPYALHVKGILVFSIFKCILGSLLFITGIVNVILVKYYPLLGIGMWSGLTILANGVIGCILNYKQSKCLIGAFLALSITSLIFDVSMLSYYSVVLEYYVDFRYLYCYYIRNTRYCWSRLTRGSRSLGIGVSSFLIFLAVCELASSIGSVVLSSKAYCKCCNTCDTSDCCTCLGCCECDTTPLKEQQANTTAQSPAGYDMQGFQYKPCPGCMNFAINIPAYLFDGANGTPMSAITFNIEAAPLNQQIPVTGPVRNNIQANVTAVVT